MLKSVKKSRLVMAGGTLTCALGIGVLMQMSASGPASAELPKLTTASVNVVTLATGDNADDSMTNDTAIVSVDPDEPQTHGKTVASGNEPAREPENPANPAEQIGTAKATDPEGGNLDIEQITLTRAEPAPPATAPQPQALPADPLEVNVAALADSAVSDLPTEESAPGFSCEIEMSAAPGEVALVALDLTAPCRTNQRFTLHHNGMMITALTDDEGRWTGDVPALSEQALFIAAFPDGEGAVANTAVGTLSDYDRYVVQWKGYSGMQIHALEYDADYGQDGHVWHDTARDAAVAARGEGGFLMRLGDAGLDDALLAEVYTFPTGTALRGGDVEISLETEITRQNCGRDVQAQVLVKTADGVIGARDLELAVPDCNAVGDFLVLKNLYEDLKIALN